METKDRIELELNYYHLHKSLSDIEAQKFLAILMYTSLNYDEEVNVINKELDGYSKLINDKIEELNSMIQEFNYRKQKYKSHLNNLNLIKNNINFTKEDFISKEELINLFPKIDFTSCLVKDPLFKLFLSS